MPSFERQTEKDRKLKARSGYIVRGCLQKPGGKRAEWVRAFVVKSDD